MFYNIEDTLCLFEEYKLSQEELNSCRKRLLAVEPSLCITEEEGCSEQEDWEDVFYFIEDRKKIICVIPNSWEVNVPQIFVLSDEGDYEMKDKEIFEFLTYVYEKRSDLRLSNMQFTLGEETPSHTGLLYYVACYLTEPPKEPEICTMYDNYHSGVIGISEPKELDIDEAIRLIQIVLSTVYNYHQPYKLTSKDKEELELFGSVEVVF